MNVPKIPGIDLEGAGNWETGEGNPIGKKYNE
jgi:hypothetical protein